MLDPIRCSLKVQQAAMISTCCAAGIMAHNWLRLLKGEQSLLELPFHRRSEDAYAHKDYIPKGARWNDHYGKRSHDVDVEHMR